MSPPDTDATLPAVDDRLVAPETRYEIIDGRVVYVAPADEPHAEAHSALGALLRAHRDDAYNVALDMLTRTSPVGDMAPDASVYPAARDSETGGRQLDELAFEIVSTQSIHDAGTKAARLSARGVRRVFAIDIERGRVLEWSPALDQWSLVDPHASIVDQALAIPLPVEALVDSVRGDDAVVRAFRLKRHPEFLAERAEALAEAVLRLLTARGLAPTVEER